GDFGYGTVSRAHGNRMQRNCVIRVYEIHEGALGVALDDLVRHEGHIVVRIDEQTRIHELIWEQEVLLVLKERLGFNGARGGIDLVVESLQRASSELLLLSAIKCVHHEFPSLA